jgi:hypothetical protein
MRYVGYFFRRPRESGDPVAFIKRHWIPAFAGMTTLGIPASLTFIIRTIAFPGEQA